MKNTKHEIKICEKCQSGFECRMGDISRCQCTEVVLSPMTQQFLVQTDHDCLCKNCLTTLNNRLAILENETFPQAQDLREGFHYYMEKGFWVFTENYHLLRGYCCRSGCRHCPYGFRKEEMMNDE